MRRMGNEEHNLLEKAMDKMKAMYDQDMEEMQAREEKHEKELLMRKDLEKQSAILQTVIITIASVGTAASILAYISKD